MKRRYRNAGARHAHETETEKNVTNLRKVDNLVRRLKRLSNPTMNGANNKSVKGSTLKKGIIDSITNPKI